MERERVDVDVDVDVGARREAVLVGVDVGVDVERDVGVAVVAASLLPRAVRMRTPLDRDRTPLDRALDRALRPLARLRTECKLHTYLGGFMRGSFGVWGVMVEKWREEVVVGGMKEWLWMKMMMLLLLLLLLMMTMTMMTGWERRKERWREDGAASCPRREGVLRQRVRARSSPGWRGGPCRRRLRG